MPKFELVIPAYNESMNLEMVIRKSIFAAKTFGFTSSDFQIVLVQNGSTDDSEKILKRLKTKELGAWFRVITLKKNAGHGGGIWEGLKNTTAPIIGWTHGDLQCDPRDCFTAYAKQWNNQKKNLLTLIKGVRFGRSHTKIFTSRVFELCARFLLGFKCFEVNAQPKVFHRNLLSEMKNPPTTLAFDLYFLYQTTRAGYYLETIPVQIPNRIHGSSKWSYSLLSRYKTIGEVIRYMIKLRKESKHALELQKTQAVV